MCQLDAVVSTVKTYVADFDPERVHGADAVHLVDVFATLERLCVAGRVLAARRVEQTDAWKSDGSRSAEDWLARTTHTSRSAAAGVLSTGRHLQGLSATTAALRCGALSEHQTAELAAAGAADPGAETRLLAEAGRASLVGLQKTCRAVRVAATDTALVDRERVHRTRYLRHWTSPDGAFEGRFRLTADHGAIVAAALQTSSNLIFHQARADKRYEPGDAYRADALVDLARTYNQFPDTDPAPNGEPADAPAPDAGPPGGPAPDAEPPGGPAPDAGPNGDPLAGSRPPGAGPPDGRPPSVPTPAAHPPGGQTPGAPPATGRRRPSSRPTAIINICVDHAALVRGHTNPGETCEITGIGPVPVETVRAAAGDAILRAVLTNGDTIVDVIHVGRTIPAKLRAAVAHRDRSCAVPGCDTMRHLEIHHLRPFALGGPTTLSNTCRICTFHHDQITYSKARLTGTPPDWTWHPPPDPEATDRWRPPDDSPPGGGPDKAPPPVPRERRSAPPPPMPGERGPSPPPPQAPSPRQRPAPGELR